MVNVLLFFLAFARWHVAMAFIEIFPSFVTRATNNQMWINGFLVGAIIAKNYVKMVAYFFIATFISPCVSSLRVYVQHQVFDNAFESTKCNLSFTESCFFLHRGIVKKNYNQIELYLIRILVLFELNFCWCYTWNFQQPLYFGKLHKRRETEKEFIYNILCSVPKH